MKSKIEILSTRPVDEELIEAAFKRDISIDVLSFIETEPVETVEIQQEIENAVLLSATIVFTSMNAVEAVSYFIEEEMPEWKIYCIGHTTKQLVAKYFGERMIAGDADSATELAELIIEESGGEDVIFFCGDRRRDELPRLLRGQSIDVNEIIVYETITVPHKVTKEYYGILFFSPSAVDCFFSVNKINDKTVLFAIGETTADTIRKYSGNKILTADIPTKEDLTEKMIEYFAG